ncbi:MAG: hypothetical protein Q8N03_10450 [Ignavibacteria bacterium]|nr:hypothetical protein [Ignavibacteria bacterium]
MVLFPKYGRLLVLTILTFSSLSVIAPAQTRTVSSTVQITSTAINRFIAAQTFPTLNGSASGYTYSISIAEPTVQLNTNSAAIQFTINANTSAGNYSIKVQPTITIPNLSVTVSQIIATLQQFDVLINSRPDIPSWLKSVIINGYNSLNLVIYPSKLIDYANSAVPDFVNIQVTDIGLTFTVVPDAITFTLTATVLGAPPVFTAQWLKPEAYKCKIRFGGNVATTIKQVRVYNLLPAEVYKNENLNLSISKDGYSTEINMNISSVATYYIVVLFHSEYGEYSRKYWFTYNTATYNTWFDATQSNAIN